MLEVEISKGTRTAHVTEIFHILNEITFRVDNFVDSLLALLLLVGEAIGDFFGYGVYPESTRFLNQVVIYRKMVNFRGDIPQGRRATLD
jgi:hypothetical protein